MTDFEYETLDRAIEDALAAFGNADALTHWWLHDRERMLAHVVGDVRSTLRALAMRSVNIDVTDSEIVWMTVNRIADTGVPARLAQVESQWSPYA